MGTLLSKITSAMLVGRPLDATRHHGLLGCRGVCGIVLAAALRCFYCKLLGCEAAGHLTCTAAQALCSMEDIETPHLLCVAGLHGLASRTSHGHSCYLAKHCL